MTSTTPIPTPGTPLTIVGYGASGNGTRGCINDADDNRRMATTLLGAFAAPTSPPYTQSSNQNFYLSQFRDPSNPTDPNFYNLTVPVPGLQGGICGGDSGGPASLRVSVPFLAS
jgi:hypothetical protein